MTRFWAHLFLAGMLGAVIFSGCGAGLANIEEKPPELHTTIDPFDFSDEFITVPITKEAETVETGGAVVEQMPNVKPDSSVVDTGIQQNGVDEQAMTVSTATMRGYRVQVGAFEVKENAERMKDYVGRKFNQPVYLEYQPPFYRVRMGNYTDLREAETYVEMLRENGFQDARWVPATIIAQ